MNRGYSEAEDSPWFDDGNDHSEGLVRGSDNVLQGKGIAEDVIGQVYAGRVSHHTSLHDGSSRNGDLQRSNVAGSPEAVVQVTVVGL